MGDPFNMDLEAACEVRGMLSSMSNGVFVGREDLLYDPERKLTDEERELKERLERASEHLTSALRELEAAFAVLGTPLDLRSASGRPLALRAAVDARRV